METNQCALTKTIPVRNVGQPLNIEEQLHTRFDLDAQLFATQTRDRIFTTVRSRGPGLGLVSVL